MYDELVKRLREADEKSMCGECGLNLHTGATKKGVLFAEAADAIEELICEVADEHNARLDAESRQRWIPVTERLPNNGKNVLVFEFGRVEQAYTTTYTADGSLCWVVINGGSYHRISDADCPIKWWMPLPQPPKEE